MDLDTVVHNILAPHAFKIKEHIVNTILEETVETVLDCLKEGQRKEEIVAQVIEKFTKKEGA